MVDKVYTNFKLANAGLPNAHPDARNCECVCEFW